jgi:Arc/MetJ-type ribon-helix-helix transcriptional regulator
MGDSKIEPKKEKLSATISPYLKDRIDTLVNDGKFSSASELTSTALAYFFGCYDVRMNEEKKRKEGNNKKPA